MTQDVTTPVQIEAGRAERDGCDCPAWTARCAHWDGAVACLLNRELLPECDGAGVHPGPEQWAVIVLPEGWNAMCGCPGKHIAHWAQEGMRDEYFTDEAAALEAFHAAEETLLRGEPS